MAAFEDPELYGDDRIVMGSGTDQLVITISDGGLYVVDNDTGESRNYYSVHFLNDSFETSVHDVMGPEDEDPNLPEARVNVIAMMANWDYMDVSVDPIVPKYDFGPEVANWCMRNEDELKHVWNSLVPA